MRVEGEDIEEEGPTMAKRTRARGLRYGLEHVAWVRAVLAGWLARATALKRAEQTLKVCAPKVLNTLIAEKSCSAVGGGAERSGSPDGSEFAVASSAFDLVSAVWQSLPLEETGARQ